MSIKSWAHGFLLAGCLALLAGCAHVDGPTDVSGGTLTKATKQWQLAGRFVAGQRSEGDGHDVVDGVAGRFAWQHQPQADTVWLIGPIGNALAKIDVLPNSVRWQDASGRRGDVQNLSALGESLAGIRLPDVPSEFWLRGQWPQTAVRARDAEGRIQQAGVQGWIFDYRYGAPAPAGWPLAIEGVGPAGLWLRVALTGWDEVVDPAERPAP